MDYKARMYDSTLGRFIQPDTIIPNPADPQSWNRFSYTSNNPVRYTDPTGHRLEIGCGEGSDCVLPDPKGPKTEYGYEEFQLLRGFELYEVDPAATGAYSDFQGGGDPKYFWRVPGVRAQGGSGAGWYDAFGIVNDQLAGWRDPYQRAHTPYDQSIRISYQTSYDGAPRLNASKTVNIVGMQITNGAVIDMTMHYRVSIAGGDRNIRTGGSAPRGGSTNLPGTYGIATRDGEQGPHVVVQASGTWGSLQFYGWADFVFNP
jgi:hypothetical protein